MREAGQANMQGLQGHGRALERRGSLRGRRAELRLQHCDQPRARCGGPSMLRPPLPQSACAALSSTLAASMQLLHAAPAAPCSCSAAQAARVCPTAGCLAACSAAYLAACMSVMVSPLRRMRPSALRVFRFTDTSSASSSTRFMYSSKPMMRPSIRRSLCS